MRSSDALSCFIVAVSLVVITAQLPMQGGLKFGKFESLKAMAMFLPLLALLNHMMGAGCRKPRRRCSVVKARKVLLHEFEGSSLTGQTKKSLVFSTITRTGELRSKWQEDSVVQ